MTLNKKQVLQLIKDNFTFIIACNSMHVGKGMKMAPKAKLNDAIQEGFAIAKNNNSLTY